MRDWYYANGDVWVFTPHIYALLPVALLGIGPLALRLTVIFGFGLELLVLRWAYRRVTQHGWSSAFATTMTLIAWSRLHILFVFVELSYGFAAALYVALFTLFGIALSGAPRSRLERFSLPIASIVLFVACLQNPSRGAVFLVAPVLLVCVWPWRGVSLRARARIFGAAVAPWGVALVVYQRVFRKILSFSVPSGHSEFVLKDASGIGDNIAMLWKGLVALSGRLEGFDVLVIPALVMTVGSIILVGYEVLSGRGLTLIRLLGLCVGAQFMAALLPMLLGNLMVNPPSARYLMPSLMPILGLAVIVAVRTQTAEKAASRAGRGLSAVWLGLLPVVAIISLFRTVSTYSLEAQNGQWAHRKAHAELADELSRRGLTLGYSTYWNANLITLLSHGATKACSVNFRDGIIPYKWLADTECYDPAFLPERIYVVAAPDEEGAAHRASLASLHEPIDSFVVGDFFHVSVWRTKDISVGWLALPLPDGEQIQFPLHLRATHIQLSRGHVTEDAEHADRITATGEDGVLVYGPYIQLPKGDYRLRWTGVGIDSPGDLHFDVAVRGGKVVVEQNADATALAKTAPPAAAPAPAGDLIHLDFSLPTDSPAFEARIYSRGGAKVTLDELILEKR